MGFCSAVTLAFATIFSLVAAALLAIAFSTDNWITISVQRKDLEVRKHLKRVINCQFKMLSSKFYCLKLNRDLVKTVLIEFKLTYWHNAPHPQLLSYWLIAVCLQSNSCIFWCSKWLNPSFSVKSIPNATSHKTPLNPGLVPGLPWQQQLTSVPHWVGDSQNLSAKSASNLSQFWHLTDRRTMCFMIRIIFCDGMQQHARALDANNDMNDVKW